MTEEVIRSERVEAITRLVCAFITIANFALSLWGINPLPFADDEVYMIVSVVCATAATLWVWWKNNNITKEAVEAQEFLDDLKKPDIKIGGSN